MKMPEVSYDEFEDPKKIYDDLIGRCNQVKSWKISCYVSENWVGGHLPFKMDIIDGIYICSVIAPTKRDALLLVVNNLPVIKFLEEDN